MNNVTYFILCYFFLYELFLYYALLFLFYFYLSPSFPSSPLLCYNRSSSLPFFPLTTPLFSSLLFSPHLSVYFHSPRKYLTPLLCFSSPLCYFPIPISPLLPSQSCLLSLVLPPVYSHLSPWAALKSCCQ